MSKRTNLAVIVGAFLCGAMMMAQSQTAAPAAAPREISWSEAQKLLTKPFALQYPDEAKANHIEGTVVYKVTVRSNGQYGAMVKVSGSSLLSEACLDSIKASSFRPLQVNGHAVAFTTKVPCAFGAAAESTSASASVQSEPAKPAVTVLECTLPAMPGTENTFMRRGLRGGEAYNERIVGPGGIWAAPFTFVFHSDDTAWSHNEAEYWIVGAYEGIFVDAIPDESARNRFGHLDASKLTTVTEFIISRSNTTVIESTQITGSTLRDYNNTELWEGKATRTGECHPFKPKI